MYLIKLFSGSFIWLMFAGLILVSDCHRAMAEDEGESIDKAIAPFKEPKLVVVIAVDQLRRDRLLEAVDGGLKRLVDGGRRFANGSIAHALTTTCPGHAVVMTGLNPESHGIPDNTFYDRLEGKVRYCVEDDDAGARVLGGSLGRSPKNLQATTLGDWLKEANGVSRVMSVSGKDRAAITMAGQAPDQVFWYDKTQGRFTSSGYYAPVLPEYVRRFNGTDPTADGFMRGFPSHWTHSEGRHRVDDFQGEDPRYGRVSGHPIRSGSFDAIAEQVYYSPFLDQATLELARLMIDEEQLGRGDEVDLLTISLSATDTIGHLYGPRSAEAEDALVRLDQDLGRFMTHLDETVGSDQYWLVITADHGVAELPEYTSTEGTLECPTETGRLEPESLYLGLAWHIYSRFTWPFGHPESLVALDRGHLVVQEEGLERFDVSKAAVLDELSRYLETYPEIERVWSLDELQDASDEMAIRIRKSWVEARSGDLFVQLKKGCLIDAIGTTHGSPYDYDLDIPILFYGQGIAPGVVDGSAYSVDIAATLASYLNVMPDHKLDGVVLDLGPGISVSVP